MSQKRSTEILRFDRRSDKQAKFVLVWQFSRHHFTSLHHTKPTRICTKNEGLLVESRTSMLKIKQAKSTLNVIPEAITNYAVHFVFRANSPPQARTDLDNHFQPQTVGAGADSCGAFSQVRYKSGADPEEILCQLERLRSQMEAQRTTNARENVHA